MKTRTKRYLCEAAGWMALLGMLIIIGGMERGWMPIGRGAALAILSELIGAALLYKAGVIRI